MNQDVSVKKIEDKSQKRLDFILNYALYFILGVMIVGIIAYDPTFLNLGNFKNILLQSTTRGIMALGVAGLIILQGTDLSAGRIMGLTAAISASLLQSVTFSGRMYPELGEISMLIPLFLAILVGGILGLFNGIGVAILKVHAFIITLGTQLIAYGLIQIYISIQQGGMQPIGTLQDRYLQVARGTLNIFGLKIPYLILILAAVAVVMWLVWNKTKLGKNMYAIGGNPEAAAVSGVSVVKNILVIYLISGLLYGFAGFLEAARTGSVNVGTGTNFELDAISACVVGGISFAGGVGKISGVLIGTVILTFINYGLNYIGMNIYLQYIIRGAIIITAVAIDVRKYIAKK